MVFHITTKIADALMEEFTQLWNRLTQFTHWAFGNEQKRPLSIFAKNANNALKTQLNCLEKQNVLLLPSK